MNAHTLHDFDRKHLDEFLTLVRPMSPGYGRVAVSYFAAKQGSDFVLHQGRLHLLSGPTQIPIGHFASENVRAGCFDVKETHRSIDDALNDLLSGNLTTPDEVFAFPPDQNGRYSIYFNPFHPDGIQSQRRQMQLIISGAPRSHLDLTRVDWELKAARTPYENTQDLCAEYAIAPLTGGQVNVEVIAHNVAAIHPASTITGEKARVTLVLADGLEQEKGSLGIRLFDKNRVVMRQQILGAEMTWQKHDGLQHGSTEITVPSGAILHCIANFAGEAHSHFWVTDPSTTPNPRRAIHEAFDSKMEVLQDLLRIQGRGRDARDFECAIAWLLWMLGFSVTHLGGTPRTADAVDLIATTPKGNVLVIECTTGLLKAENKLPNLVDRTEKVRRCLTNSGNAFLKVLPVIVTNKSREEVQADLEQADKLGVVVVTKESFGDAINRTHLVSDPDQLFEAAATSVQKAQPSSLHDPTQLSS